MNRLVETQNIIFEEIKRLGENDLINDDKKLKKEIVRSTAIYNQTVGFAKMINANMNIVRMSNKDKSQIEKLSKLLGLE